MIATEVNDIVEEYQIGSVLNFVFGLFFVFSIISAKSLSCPNFYKFKKAKLLFLQIVRFYSQ